MITHYIVAFLISLAAGYWVLTLAGKEKDHTKTIGRVIAWILIVVSLIGPVCLAATACYRHSHGLTRGFSMERRWAGGGWNRHGNWHPGLKNGRWSSNGPGMMHRKDMMQGPGSMEEKGVTGEKGTAQGMEKPE